VKGNIEGRVDVGLVPIEKIQHKECVRNLKSPYVQVVPTNQYVTKLILVK
jgi:hypothetical protein